MLFRIGHFYLPVSITNGLESFVQISAISAWEILVGLAATHSLHTLTPSLQLAQISIFFRLFISSLRNCL